MESMVRDGYEIQTVRPFCGKRAQRFLILSFFSARSVRAPSLVSAHEFAGNRDKAETKRMKKRREEWGMMWRDVICDVMKEGMSSMNEG